MTCCWQLTLLQFLYALFSYLTCINVQQLQIKQQKLLDTQFEQYINRVKKTDCQAELRRLLKNGPPIYVSDKHAFPLDENDTHVCKLWFAMDRKERSAKLRGAVEGEERDALWTELNEFIIEEGKEEGDDDDEEEEGDGEK